MEHGRLSEAKVIFGISPVVVAVAKKHRRLDKNAFRPHTIGTTRPFGRFCRGGAWLALKEGTSQREVGLAAQPRGGPPSFWTHLQGSHAFARKRHHHHYRTSRPVSLATPCAGGRDSGGRGRHYIGRRNFKNHRAKPRYAGLAAHSRWLGTAAMDDRETFTLPGPTASALSGDTHDLIDRDGVAGAHAAPAHRFGKTSAIRRPLWPVLSRGGRVAVAACGGVLLFGVAVGCGLNRFRAG